VWGERRNAAGGRGKPDSERVISAQGFLIMRVFSIGGKKGCSAPIIQKTKESGLPSNGSPQGLVLLGVDGGGGRRRCHRVKR